MFYTIGLAVAASYEGDWYRAQIISLQPGHVKVKYIDYGNTEIVAADQIRVLTRDFQELPAQAVCLSIHGISPVSGDTWSDKVGCDKPLIMDVFRWYYTESNILPVTLSKFYFDKVLWRREICCRFYDQVTQNIPIETFSKHTFVQFKYLTIFYSLPTTDSDSDSESDHDSDSDSDTEF